MFEILLILALIIGLPLTLWLLDEWLKGRRRTSKMYAQRNEGEPE